MRLVGIALFLPLPNAALAPAAVRPGARPVLYT